MTLSDWPATVPTLTDGCLSLRGWSDRDADSVYAACQDAEIQRWMDVPAPYLREHAVQFVGEQSAGQWAAQAGAPFAIARRADDQILGSCALVNVDAQHLVAEVTYAVAPWARGDRVAQRAVGILCDWAFRDLGIVRLEFYIEPENAASRAVAERVGCRPQGRLRGDLPAARHRRELVLYVLIKTDARPQAGSYRHRTSNQRP